VLDAGHIAIESELADSDQLKEVRSKRGQQYNDEDYRQLEGLMYDKMSLRLEATQVSSISHTMWEANRYEAAHGTRY
jgi:vacuolar protein sorting-associated protein 13A/C